METTLNQTSVSLDDAQRVIAAGQARADEIESPSNGNGRGVYPVVPAGVWAQLERVDGAGGRERAPESRCGW
ncbi:hypothetical protein ACTD5D_19050 [Nocardia takedensis]|uniref:hypothetical protein n=1 Tax=Nocardia takedensis TaxID=259390 RepID=UPI00030F901D|nr:hypothetical protein [Nocardia takedensis]